MRCSRISRCLLSVAGAWLLLAPAQAQAQAVGAPFLSPSAVHVATSSTIVVSTRIRQTNVMPGGVSLLRVSPTGVATRVGVLNDAGTNGDAVAGDGVYAGSVVVTESTEAANVSFRVSVAVRGSLKRLQSAHTPLAVLPAGAPIGLAIPDTSQLTIDPATGAEILAHSVNACFTDATPYATIVALAAQVGGTPTGRYAEVGNCHQITLAAGDGAAIDASVAFLQSQPEVRYAEPEPVVRGAACAGPICSDVNFTKVLKMAQAQQYSQGAGIVIGILDTGLDASLLTPTVGFPTAIIGSNFSNSGTPGVPSDDNGHGTLVAHIAQSTAPGSILFISKVLNANMLATERAIMLGMREAIRNGAQIINLSLGGRFQSRLMRDFINVVQDGAGVLVVSAAGNAGSSIREYPSAHMGVVAVGNVNERDQRHAGEDPSNFGNWVNIAAPGVNVAGLGQAGTGTSFSAPFVAGTAALMLSKFPTMTRPDLIAQLYRTALPIPASAGLDTCPAQPCNQDLGAGRLDAEAALGAIRLTRITSVGASAATIIRTIEVELTSASSGASLYSSQQSFLGQSTGCQVATVKNPPCISNVPFDFAALPAGRYVLRLSFRETGASFFGSVQLMAPGARFAPVVPPNNATISASNPGLAEFSLFGSGARTVYLQIDKP